MTEQEHPLLNPNEHIWVQKTNCLDKKKNMPYPFSFFDSWICQQ